MNKLIEKLIKYIEEQVRLVINATGGDARFEFLGAPTYILRHILAYFQNLGGISVTINGENLIVPVYLLEDVSVNPEGINSGYCDDAHLTNVRNSCPYFLALIPPNKLENRSISSSTTVIGVPPYLEGQKWSQHPLIREFIETALASKGCVHDVFDECVERVLTDAEALDEHLNDRAWQWNRLEVLFNSGHQNNERCDEVVAACGLPRALNEKKSIRHAEELVIKITEKMVSEGLVKFFELIVESLEDIFIDRRDIIDSTKLALDDLKRHLLTQITNAQQFELAPRVYYSPYRDGNYSLELPTWWKILTSEMWDKLLEDDSVSPEEDLNVKLVNTLYFPKKGHPYVVQDIASFKVESTPSGIVPANVDVNRGIGTRAMVQVGEIDTNFNVVWEDNAPPSHEKYLRYKFSVPSDALNDCVVRLISLENFIPGVVIDAKAAKKITLLKKAKGSSPRKAIWECELTLLGKEIQHHFDIYFNSKVKLANSVKYFTSNGKPLHEEHFHAEHAGKNQVVLELGEEGHIELSGVMEDTNREFVIHIRLHLEDIEASGVRSWFEKLTELHCASSSNLATHRIDVTWSRSQQLAKWILDDKDSYYPLVMGYDYRETWKNPHWNSLPIMSKYLFSNDIRPRKGEFAPPENLLECRESIRNIVNAEDGVIEIVNLGKLAEDADIRSKIVAYIKAYSEWLRSDRDNALWFDTVAIIGPEATGSVLSQQPDAILLNPMHPIRLGWQFLAQKVLYDSLMKQKYCPAAGIFDPCSTPDCMMLPCWTAGQQIHPAHFISVASDSDYWAVLWNGSAIDRLSDRTVVTFFDEDFGIRLDGIAAGFTVSQVGRSLKDIAMIRSARVCLRVRLIDDTSGSSSCTEGITGWASDNLGENDLWLNAGATSLEVYDERNRVQWPSARKVANLTSDTHAAVRWFKGSSKGRGAIDLTIINHLGSMNPELAKHDIPSAVGHGALIRQRIRRQLPTITGNHFVSETRKSPQRHQAGDDLSEVIEHLSWQLENTCDDVDSYVFSPKMIKIQENLKQSRYCAVSSSIVDPSCFFDADKNAYLWDYDIPAYARRTGSNNGYYLIASETEAILQAVRKNLSAIAPDGYHLDDDMIRSILREISGRGFPTLKRLVIQGASSTGEIGLLVALRLLQNRKLVSEAIFPLIEDKYVNLVIPVDPFRNMLSDLKSKLGLSGSRPDILAVSIHYHHQQISVRFTPIEVKHRSGCLMENEKKSALEQASEFSKFMAAMESLAETEHIWRYAMTSLLVTMIDFGFRATSVARGMGGSKEWAEIHSGVLQAIISGEAKREIDGRGRLIIIDKSSSNIFDLDNDSFKETLVIKTTDAFEVITSESMEYVKKIKASLHDWELLAIARDFKTHMHRERKVAEVEDAGEAIKPIPMPPLTEGGIAFVEASEMKEHIHQVNEVTQALGIRFPVGKDITSPFQDPDVYFHPSNTQLNQLNIGIVGDLGTGKTQLTKSLIYRFVNSEKENSGIRPSFLIFDYKGDYLDPEFIGAIGGCVIKPHRIPLNLFDISGKEAVANPIIDTVSFFNDIVGKIYKVDKPNQQYLLKEAIKECYGSLHVSEGTYPTIYDVHNAYKMKLNGKVDSTLSILSDIVDRELFENKASGVKPFKEFFKGVTVIDLKSLGPDDNTKNMLVVIFLHLFYDHMLKIEKRVPSGDSLKLRVIDSMLLVDEANSIMKYNFDVLDNILLQGREFGVGVLLASQYLSHFKTSQKNYAQPLLTWFIHKVPIITKKELESIGLIDVDTDIIERIKSLNIHECLYKSFDTHKKGLFTYGYPFYKIIKDK